MSEYEIDGDIKYQIYHFDDRAFIFKKSEMTNVGYEVLVFSPNHKIYHLDGKQHRVNGPAYIQEDGFQTWCIHGKIHREDAPAQIFPDGRVIWWSNDQKHRIGGPAETLKNGMNRYWLFDKQYNKHMYNRIIFHSCIFCDYITNNRNNRNELLVHYDYEEEQNSKVIPKELMKLLNGDNT